MSLFSIGVTRSVRLHGVMVPWIDVEDRGNTPSRQTPGCATSALPRAANSTAPGANRRSSSEASRRPGMSSTHQGIILNHLDFVLVQNGRSVGVRQVRFNVGTS